MSNGAVVVRSNNHMTVAGRPLPKRQLKQIGVSIVVSAAALLAEIGVIYLRRRLRKGSLPRLISRRNHQISAVVDDQSPGSVPSGKRVVSVYRERVVEERRWGRPVRRIVDRMAWRSEEEIDTR
ncbi:MAG: hypothetical protein R3293_04715 [Candidatus Promineifilaceae bacterium]|nr:hypothetical protein [Candidatus Promineifilaceae bacterium]